MYLAEKNIENNEPSSHHKNVSFFFLKKLEREQINLEKLEGN